MTDWGELAARARRGGLQLTARSARTVVFIGENGTAFPLALFAAAASDDPAVRTRLGSAWPLPGVEIDRRRRLVLHPG